MRRHELARVREQETGAGGGGVRGVQRGAGHLCWGQQAGVSPLHRQVSPPDGAGDREDRGRGSGSARPETGSSILHRPRRSRRILSRRPVSIGGLYGGWRMETLVEKLRDQVTNDAVEI